MLIAINIGKANGADDISAKAIRLVAGQFVPSVAYLFNESFRLGTFPSAWKLACVSPLHKGGDSSNRDNQRPISILPCLSKVYEGLANLQLQDYACESKMISDKQFAYKKFSSCNVAQSSKCGPLSLETPLSASFQFRQLICKLSKIRQVVKHKLGFE